MSLWDNFLDTLTDFVEDAGDALTDFIQDTGDALSDFLESAGTITYGNYGGLNYSAGVVGGTITETSPPPVNAYDAAFLSARPYLPKFLRPSSAFASRRSTRRKPHRSSAAGG